MMHFDIPLRVAGRLAAALILLAAFGASSASAQSHWRSFSSRDDDGQVICGVRTDMTNGGSLNVLVYSSKIHMIATDPDWSFRRSGAVRIAASIDGSGFNGSGQVTDDMSVIVPDLSTNFLRSFIRGYRMLIDFNNIRWTVNLSGSARATAELVRCLDGAQYRY